MTPRSIRRAAERRAQKEARKAERSAAVTPQPPVAPPIDPAMEIIEPRVAANRANAQLSTGPRTEAGKRISSLNAVKSGLTGRTVLLPSDDAARYGQHVNRWFAEYKPVGDREIELVQSIADIQWRLNRIPGLELAIFARGRVEFAELYADFDVATAIALIDAETLTVYGKQISNLYTQESRLQRQRTKDLAELQLLQAERKRKTPKSTAAPAPHPSAQLENGFEFSSGDTDCFEEHLGALEQHLGLPVYSEWELPKAA